MFFCITGYYDVLLITIHMQLMATMRYLDQLETEMSRDQFEDLVRKVKLAIATRLRTSASGAVVLEDACQVSRYFILLHIATHYLHVYIMKFGMNHTFSSRRRLQPMGWIQFSPRTLRIINCSKKMFGNRLSATAVHRGPERTQSTTLGGRCLPCS